jgi:lipopolysaccharide/colanic/teichoic acid biosynthesis glycosyltransferase
VPAQREASDSLVLATAAGSLNYSADLESSAFSGPASDTSELLSRIKSKRRERLVVRTLAVTSDLVAIVLSYLLASFVWLGDPFQIHALNCLMIVTPIYLVAAANIGAYGIESTLRLWSSVMRVVGSLLFTLAAISLIIFILRMGTEFSRAVFMLGSSTALLFLPIGRLLIFPPARSLLNGAVRSTLVIIDGIEYTPSDQHEIVVTPEQLRFDPKTSDPIRFHWLAESVGELDRVIVGCSVEKYALWSSVLKGLAIDGEILTDEDDKIGILGIGAHGSYRTMVVAAGPLHLRERILKRTFDIVLSALALILLSPLLLTVAIAIKLESKGPVLFVQRRIGRHNKLFPLYKFRSMYTELCDPNAVTLTSRSDPRVTSVGEFIRRTSIDELPQLINVLKGEMSLVGPRPHAMSAKAADLLYWDVDPRYRHRHSMKPGLTGLAQVRGFRGATDRTEDLVNRLTSDLEYVANWSILEDLRIIFRTLRVLRHDNAF